MNELNRLTISPFFILGAVLFFWIKKRMKSHGEDMYDDNFYRPTYINITIFAYTLAFCGFINLLFYLLGID